MKASIAQCSGSFQAKGGRMIDLSDRTKAESFMDLRALSENFTICSRENLGVKRAVFCYAGNKLQLRGESGAP